MSGNVNDGQHRSSGGQPANSDQRTRVAPDSRQPADARENGWPVGAGRPDADVSTERRRGVRDAMRNRPER